MSTRAIASADRIREQVPIVKVLAALGYDVREDMGDREQQFRCDLHGSGLDNAPSARVYPESNTYYCWGCQVSRDAIELTRIKRDCGFWEAIKMLEQAVGLEPLPIEYGTDQRERGDQNLSEMQGQINQGRTYEKEEDRVRKVLNSRTSDRDVPFSRLLTYWETYDRIVYHVRGPHGDGGTWSEQRGSQFMVALLERIQEETKSPSE